jgi:NAD+ synthase (glutamine-hydrolysing)
MRIALAQINTIIGDFTGNLEKIKSYIQRAKDAQADLVCFGELVTCGYPPRDFLEFKDFISQANETLEAIAQMADGIAVIIGSPSVNQRIEGKDLFNSVFLLEDKIIRHRSDKALLPTYDIFDEYRYFEPASEFQTVVFQGKRIALTICEDIWNIDNENPMYTICPMDTLSVQEPDLMINVSASPFHYQHATERISKVKENALRYKLPVFYVNHVGCQTDVIFDGGSLVVTSKGQVYDEMDYFVEEMKVFDLEEIEKCTVDKVQPKEKVSLIHDALVLGISDYFRKLGFKKAVLGLSGGIDSALATTLAVEALGRENVRVLLMPSEYSSEHSLVDAMALANNLRIRFDVVPIKDINASYLTTLQPWFEELPSNVTEENLQARIRGMLLMAISNKFGNILLNTSNKSEMAVGYGTLYGDMCGGLAVLGDLYKTEVYEVARYINRDKEIIPENSLIKPPSAELRPGQKDSDSLPPYDILDPVLYEYIENRKGPKEIIAMGYDKALVERVLRMVNINEFKREQTAPVLRISSKAFGMGRRMPIVGKYLS